MKPTSPYNKVLEQLTNRALTSCNRAIEFEIVEGWSARTQTAWMHYREDLYALGKMTNAALDDLAAMELAAEMELEQVREAA